MTYTQYNYNKNNTPQYQKKEPPPCNYCGDPLKFKKDDQTGRWIRFNLDGSAHNREFCEKRIESKKIAASSGQVDRTSTSTSSTTTTMGAIDPHLNSLLIKVSDAQKAIMELKQLLFNLEKSAQTNATVIDSMAQKIELLIAKQGYPEPQKIMAKVDPIKYRCKNCNKVYPDYDSHSKEYCRDCLKNKEEKEELGLLKNIATELANKEEKSEEEPTEVINPYRVNIHEHDEQEEKEEEKEEVDSEKSAQIFKEQVLPAMEKTMPTTETDSPWNEITSGMAFMCNSCQKKSDKGYEKWSTRICDKCHNEIEETKHAMAYSEARDLEREDRFGDEI